MKNTNNLVPVPKIEGCKIKYVNQKYLLLSRMTPGLEMQQEDKQNDRVQGYDQLPEQPNKIVLLCQVFQAQYQNNRLHRDFHPIEM